MDSINYLKVYGLEQKNGNLFYKRTPHGNYVVFWQSYNNIDVFLCKWLPDSYEDISEICVIDKIFSFDYTKKEKVAKFKLMLKH